MGTNYYRIKKASRKDKEEVIDLINSDKLELAQEKLSEIIDKVHICKSSFGWQIRFDHNNGKYYKPNKESLDKFLREDETYIEDEYGEKISVDDFWKFVEAHNSNPRNSFTSESYDKWEKENNPSYFPYKCAEDIRNVYSLFGIETHENDFQVDGLRFAVYTDFR